MMSEFFVVRENDKIIALFMSEQRAKFYCRENLAKSALSERRMDN